MRIILMKLLLLISSLLMSFSLYANNKPVWEHWSTNETTTTPTDGYRTDTADFNQDGHPDIVVASLDDDKLSVYINDGSGQFTTEVTVDTTTGVEQLREVAAGELDGSSGADFVAVDVDTDAVYLYTNDGATPTPSFTRTTLPTDIETPNGPHAVKLADIDNDNDLDILVGTQINSDDIYIYLNDGAGNFTQTHAYSAPSNLSLFDIAVADLDGDNNLDIITSDLTDEYDENRDYWLKGNGVGTFVKQDTYTDIGLQNVSVDSADFDGDNDNDIFAVTKTQVYWFENDGTGTFTRHQVNSVDFATISGLLGNVVDFDGDGDIDALVGRGTTIFLYENDGFGNFTQHTVSINLDRSYSVDSADFDGDGRIDISVVDRDEGQLYWFKNMAKFSVAENTTAAGTVNATDIDSDTLTYSISAGADAAKFTINTSTGALTFKNAPDYESPDDNGSNRVYNITVNVNDGTADVTMPVEVTVTDIDDHAPVITEGASKSVTMSENGSPTAFALTLNATDDDNDALTWSISSNASHGTASVSGTGLSKAISYAPTANYDGTDSFVVQVSDSGNGGTDTITVNVTINNINSLPTANAQSINLAEDTAKALTLSGSDSDGTIASYAVGTPSKGSLSGTAPNLTYTPNADYNGGDSFTFTVTDNDGGTSTSATVSITVSAVNDRPSANAQTVSGAEDSTINISLTGSDSDGTIASYATSTPSKGSLSGTAPNLTYTPNANYSGSDSFTFTVTDNDGGTSTSATVSITVSAVNDKPSANAQTVSGAEDKSISITLTGTDSDGSIASYAVGTPANGSLSGTAPNLTYTPNADYNGSDSFTFTVTDNDGGTSTSATVSITISAVNDLPSATAQAVSGNEDSTISIILTGMDSDGSIASYAASTPSNGSLSGTAPNLTYTPNVDYNGSDSFTFTVTDNDGGTSTNATVSITISAVNDLPSATAQAVSGNEDSTISIILTGMDSDGSIASYAASTPANGSLTGTAPNLTYTPNVDYNGSDSFTFTVTDNNGGTSAEEKVDIVIGAVNDAPVAEDDTATFEKNATNQYTIDVLVNDSDIEEDTLNVTSANADIGSVTVENNQLILSAPSGFIGSLSISYLISDGNKGTNSASATVTINGLFDELAPQITLPEDIEVNATGLFTKVDLGVATAIDANGNTLPVSLLDDSLKFAPGVSKAYWQSMDADGIQSISAQNIQVHPLISIGKDQTVVEGSTVTVKLYLNGTSPSYPVIVPYTVSGTAVEGEDHSLFAGEVEISEANVASLTFEVYDDGVGDSNEDIVISLSDTVNISSHSVQVVTLYEGNVAPAVSLTAIQKDENRALLSQSDGQVTINAKITDQNIGDSHTLQWSSTSDELNVLVNSETSEQIFFNVETLPVGTHKLTAIATDYGEPALTTEADIYLKVLSTLPTLSDIDTDGDLIPDSQEGFSDTDGDGIADYLDAINDCSVMPEVVTTQVNYLVEGEPGVCLRRGSASPDTQSGSLLLTLEETIQAVGEDLETQNVGGIFDYIVYGLVNPGQNYKLVLPQRQPIPAGAIYRKYTDTAGWSNFVEDENNQLFSTQGEPGFCPPPGSSLWQLGLTEGHWCVQLNIVDGGPNDNDGIANGTIVDPGGVAVYISKNTAPTAENDTITTIWNEEVEIDVLANDIDVDGDALTVLNATAKFGTVNLISNSTLNYIPRANYIGMETITYVISDGNGGIANADVSIEIVGNMAPVANDDSASTDDRTGITIDVLNNDTDADGDVLTIQSVSAINGSVLIVDNSIQYTPTIGFDGNDTVTYIIIDGKGSESEGTVNISVKAYESITVINESTSSGGSLGSFTLLLLSLLLLKRVKIFKLLHLIFLISVAASTSAKADFGIVVGIGQAISDVSLSELNNKLDNQYAEVISIDDTDFSWSVGVNYQFDNLWFIETSYLELGEFSTTIEGTTLSPEDFQENVASALSTSASGFTIGGGYQYDINHRWYLLANVGLFSWESDHKSKGPVTLTNNQSSIDLYYGIGVGNQLMENFKINLNYTSYNLESNNVNTTALTVNYHY